MSNCTQTFYHNSSRIISYKKKNPKNLRFCNLTTTELLNRKQVERERDYREAGKPKKTKTFLH